jgi:hypothetical protein
MTATPDNFGASSRQPGGPHSPDIGQPADIPEKDHRPKLPRYRQNLFTERRQARTGIADGRPPIPLRTRWLYDECNGAVELDERVVR